MKAFIEDFETRNGWRDNFVESTPGVFRVVNRRGVLSAHKTWNPMPSHTVPGLKQYTVLMTKFDVAISRGFAVGWQSQRTGPGGSKDEGEVANFGSGPIVHLERNDHCIDYYVFDADATDDTHPNGQLIRKELARFPQSYLVPAGEPKVEPIDVNFSRNPTPHFPVLQQYYRCRVVDDKMSEPKVEIVCQVVDVTDPAEHWTLIDRTDVVDLGIMDNFKDRCVFDFVVMTNAPISPQNFGQQTIDWVWLKPLDLTPQQSDRFEADKYEMLMRKAR